MAKNDRPIAKSADLIAKLSNAQTPTNRIFMLLENAKFVDKLNVLCGFSHAKHFDENNVLQSYSY